MVLRGHVGHGRVVNEGYVSCMLEGVTNIYSSPTPCLPLGKRVTILKMFVQHKHGASEHSEVTDSPRSRFPCKHLIRGELCVMLKRRVVESACMADSKQPKLLIQDRWPLRTGMQ